MKFSSGIIDDFFQMPGVQKFTTSPQSEEKKNDESPTKSKGESGETTQVTDRRSHQYDNYKNVICARNLFP